jgi:hypothetical protein
MGKKVNLPKNSIPASMVKQPTYERLKDQKVSSYRLLTKDELRQAFKEFGTVIIRVDNQTAFHRHQIQPIVYTLNKDGSLSSMNSQTLEDYDAYRKFLIDRFNKNELYTQADE